MKEITRIHIAKTPYDIESQAKKELEKYTHNLELYAEDSNLLEDIEIRITEILSDRGVERDGVISTEDIAAVRDQLGEPRDFLGEGDMAIGTIPDLDDTNRKNRRLYRDTDTAIIGGVMSGIAKYFNVDPIWLRLAFLVLLIMSFGAAFVVYAVLWIVVPPARTAAEKLELSGKPVTLASIKDLNDRLATEGPRDNKSVRFMQNILAYGASALFAIGAICSLIATAWGAAGIFLGTSFEPLARVLPDNSWEWQVAYVLFVLSGLLLTTLFTLISYAFFRKKATKRLGTALIFIVLAGIITFTAGATTVWYKSWQENSRIYDSRYTKTINLPDKFSQASSLTIDTGQVNLGWGDIADVAVEYIVETNGRPRYEITLDASTSNLQPNVTFNDDGSKAVLSMTAKERKHRNIFYSQNSHIKVYGPAMDEVFVETGSLLYYNPNSQNNLHVNANGGTFEATGGTYKNVTVNSQDVASIILSNATVENLSTNIAGGYVTAGVVRSLTVVQRDICPANSGLSNQNRIVVSSVVSNTLSYNGVKRPAETISSACGEVIIGDEGSFERNPMD